MTFLHPSVLFLLPLSAVLWYAVFIGQRTSCVWRLEWGSKSTSFDFLYPWLYCLACACLLVALARPVWDPKPVDKTVSGQDTVFLVDVSRSMNTSDVSGNSRLEAVKLALLDLLPALEGDRVALVAFAGTSVPKCPLTTDYTFFKQSLMSLDASSASRGGTLFGDALRGIKKDFATSEHPLAVWVFTDGGDQESYPVEAAQTFGESKISLFIWGVGTLEGGEVPERGVSSALNESLLRSVAGAVPESAYYGSTYPLWALEKEYRKHHKNTGTVKNSRVIWTEGSWFLVWPALLLIAADMVIRAFNGKRKERK